MNMYFPLWLKYCESRGGYLAEITTEAEQVLFLLPGFVYHKRLFSLETRPPCSVWSPLASTTGWASTILLRRASGFGRTPLRRQATPTGMWGSPMETATVQCWWSALKVIFLEGDLVNVNFVFHSSTPISCGTTMSANRASTVKSRSTACAKWKIQGAANDIYER